MRVAQTSRAKEAYSVQTRLRAGYDGVIYDVQVFRRGNLLSSWSFTSEDQAESFRVRLLEDLEDLSIQGFEEKYSLPQSHEAT